MMCKVITFLKERVIAYKKYPIDYKSSLVGKNVFDKQTGFALGLPVRGNGNGINTAINSVSAKLNQMDLLIFL